MQLASAKKTNANLEDENPNARGKKQVSDTPRRALGDMKNMLQFVSSNLGSLEARARHSRISHPTSSTALNFNTDDDITEECNLQEDPKIEKTLFQMQDSVILSDPENDAEYFEKLISTECYGNDYNTDDDEPIEMCGPEDEPFDCSHVLNNVEANAVLTDDFPPFQYERPNDDDDLDKT